MKVIHTITRRDVVAGQFVKVVDFVGESSDFATVLGWMRDVDQASFGSTHPLFLRRGYLNQSGEMCVAWGTHLSPQRDWTSRVHHSFYLEN